ncbi:hypothetical protein DVB88_02620 [Tsukamurella pulmonis]|nr:hypothetical protein DVB88_02620 [Tsukamurella pulmonis]
MKIEKSRVRKRKAEGFGTYRIILESGAVISIDPRLSYGLTLDEVEDYVFHGREPHSDRISQGEPMHALRPDIGPDAFVSRARS